MSHSAQAAPPRERLWEAVAAGDEYAAVAVVQDALADGIDEETVLLDVIAPVRERAGAEWAADRIRSRAGARHHGRQRTGGRRSGPPAAGERSRPHVPGPGDRRLRGR